MLSRAGKASADHLNWYNVRDTYGNEKSVNLNQATWKIERFEVFVVAVAAEIETTQSV